MPVDVTVEYKGNVAVMTFDVMPTFSQLHYALRSDFVKHNAFEIHSHTLHRGTPVQLVDQNSLNRVSSDGSNFQVRILDTRKEMSRGASSPKNKTAESSRKISSPTRQQGRDPVEQERAEMPTTSASPPSGFALGSFAPSTSPMRSGRMLAPVATQHANTVGLGAHLMGLPVAANAFSVGVEHPGAVNASGTAENWLSSSTAELVQSRYIESDEGDESSAPTAARQAPTRALGLNSSPPTSAPPRGESQLAALSRGVSNSNALVAPTAAAEPAALAAARSAAFIRRSVSLDSRLVCSTAVPTSNDLWYSDGAALSVQDTATGQCILSASAASISGALVRSSSFSFAQAQAPVITVLSTVESAALGVTVWVGFDNGCVAVFDAAAIRQRTVLHGHKGAVRSIASSGTYVFTAADDGSIRQYDLDLTALHNVLTRGQDAESVVSVCAAETEAGAAPWLFAGCANRSILLWDTANSDVAVEVCDAHVGAVAALAVEPVIGGARGALHRLRLWSGADDGIIRIWDAVVPPPNTFESVEPNMVFVSEFALHSSRISQLLCSGGRMIAASADGTMSLFSIAASRHDLQENGHFPSPSVITRVNIDKVSRLGAAHHAVFACSFGRTYATRSFWACTSNGLGASSATEWEIEVDASPFDRPLEGTTDGVQVSEAAALRQRMAQRLLSDCLVEEVHGREMLVLEHERDLFRLLSLHDTIVRSQHSVTRESYLANVASVALLSHVQLGTAIITMHSSLVESLSTDVLHVLLAQTGTADANVSRLMASLRSLQADLENRIAAEQSNLKQSQMECLEWKHRCSVAVEDAAAATEKVRDLVETRDRLEDGLAHIHRQLAEADQRAALSHTRGESLEHCVKELQTKLQDAESRSAALIERIQSLESQLSAQKRAEHALALELTSVRADANGIAERLSSRDAALADCEKRYNELVKKHLDRTAEMTAQHNSDLEHQRETARQRVEAAESQTHALEMKLKELQRQLDVVADSSAASARRAEAQEAKVEAVSQHWTALLQDAKTERREEVAMMQRVIDERDTQISQLRDQLQQATLHTESLLLRTQSECRSQLAAVSHDRDMLVSQLQRVERQYASLQQQIKASNAVTQLAADKCALEERLAEVITARDDYLRHLTAVEAHYEAQQETVLTLQAQAAQCSSRLADLEHQLALSRADYAESSKQYNDVVVHSRAAEQELRSKLTSLEADAMNAADTARILEERAAHGAARASQLQTQISQALESLAAAEHRSAQQVQEIDRLTEALHAASRRAEQLGTSLAARQDEIHQLDALVAGLRLELEAAQAEVAVASKRSLELEEDAHNARQAAATESERLQEQRRALDAHIAALSAQCDSLESRLATQREEHRQALHDAEVHGLQTVEGLKNSLATVTTRSELATEHVDQLEQLLGIKEAALTQLQEAFEAVTCERDAALKKAADAVQAAQGALELQRRLHDATDEVRALSEKVQQAAELRAAEADVFEEERKMFTEQLRAKDAAMDRMHEDNDRTILLLHAAQTGLRDVAAQRLDSSYSTPASSPGAETARDRKAAISAVRQVVLIQQQRDYLLRLMNEVVVPMLEKKLICVSQTYHSVCLVALAAPTLGRQLEDQLRATVASLETQCAALRASEEQRKLLISEVQREMKELYGTYKAEVADHKKTHEQLLDATKRLGAANHHLSFHNRNRSPTSQAAEAPVEEALLAQCREGITELLDGVRDAVDLLQPVSLSPHQAPTSTTTLVALYEWLVSAQLRCEALALSLAP